MKTFDEIVKQAAKAIAIARPPETQIAELLELLVSVARFQDKPESEQTYARTLAVFDQILAQLQDDNND
jgi:hypothetical protein